MCDCKLSFSDTHSNQSECAEAVYCAPGVALVPCSRALWQGLSVLVWNQLLLCYWYQITAKSTGQLAAKNATISISKDKYPAYFPASIVYIMLLIQIFNTCKHKRYQWQVFCCFFCCVCFPLEALWLILALSVSFSFLKPVITSNCILHLCVASLVLIVHLLS